MPVTTRAGKRAKQQQIQAKPSGSTVSNTQTASRLQKIISVMSVVGNFMLDGLLNVLPPPVRLFLQAVGSHVSPVLVLPVAIVSFFIYQNMGWTFLILSDIGHRPAIKSLESDLKHGTYLRTAEVDSLLHDLDWLRRQSPYKEVHVIISGGPGAGKTELARQLGERIYKGDNYLLTFDVSSIFPPADIVTLNAENLQEVQRTLENAVGKVQGKEPDEIRHESAVTEDRIFAKFHQLRKALKNRSSLPSHPVIIFDNVKAPMFRFLYQRRDNGQFFLNPGSDEYGEMRIIVTTQHRPMTNFSSVIRYMNLFDPMPIDEAVKLLNKVSKVMNDDKNASYLAKELGGLPKSLADAAMYIQQDRQFNSSYYYYLKELKLNMENYAYNVKYAWARAVGEGVVYSLTATDASLKLIQQLIRNSGDNQFYQDLVCFIGYCGSPAISLKFLLEYVRFNDALKNYTEFQVKALVRATSMYEVKTDYGKHSLIFTHQVTRYTSLIACNERPGSNDLVQDSIAKIFHILKSELVGSDTEPSLNQMVKYTSLDFKVVDVVMSLVSSIYKQEMDLSNVVTKKFCWVFLDSLAEAYLYWPNNHKSAIIMPEVEFLVNMTEESFLKDQPEVALLLSVLYLHNTGNQKPENLARIVEMIEHFTSNSLSNQDRLSIERTALIVNMIGTVYRGAAQNMSKAQEFHEIALDISRKLNSTNEIAISLHLLGIIHRYQRNLDSARTFHEEAVELGRNIFPPNNNGRLAAFLLNLAVVYNRLGQLEQARAVYQETLQITKKMYGPRDQRVARVLNTLSTNYYALGKYNESVEALLEALSIHEEIHGDCHPNVGETLYFLGFTYRAKGELQNSLEMLSRALQIKQQYYGALHFMVAEVLHDLSNTQRELNMLDDALQNAERCIKIFRNSLKENSSSYATAINSLGHIHLALGDPNTAKLKYENALEIFKELQKHGSQDVSISETLKNIGVALKALGEADKAEECLTSALSILLKTYPDTHPRVIELRKLLKDLENEMEKS